MRVCGIYLAAGSSTRMGENKLALPFKQTTVGSSALKSALFSKLDHVIVVTKADDQLQWMDTGFFQLPFLTKWTLIRCNGAATGQAFSVKCGVEAARKRKPDGIMVILADQPFLHVKPIDELIKLGEQILKKNEKTVYLAASYLGKKRPPILFLKQIFPLLLKLTGDEGARQLLKSSSLRGITVEMDDEKIFFDIDTKEDYTKAISLVKEK